MKRRVLITGAAGRIGSFVTQQWVDHYDLVLTDVRQPAETYGFPFAQVDLSDFDAVRKLCDDIDSIVHLGADPRMEAPWESLLPNEDLARLGAANIDAPDDLTHAVFHGVSNNRWKRLDISDARRLIGYEPQDDSFESARRNAHAQP